MKRNTRIALTLFVLSAAACGGGGTDTDLESAFCAGLEANATKSVTAASDRASAIDATDAGRIDVTLPTASDRFAGYVRYSPDEAGRFAFGLTQDVGIVVRDEDGIEIPIEKSVTGSTKCTALAVRYTVPLELKPVTIEIGPADAPLIGLIAEESDDDI